MEGANASLTFDSADIEARDYRDDYGEARYRALGHVGDEYFLVAFTWRGEVRRIISA